MTWNIVEFVPELPLAYTTGRAEPGGLVGEQQGRLTVPALLIGQHHRADVPTIKQAKYSQHTFFPFLLFGPQARTCVEDLLDDHGHLAFQHGVEQLDDQDEAGSEDKERYS